MNETNLKSEVEQLLAEIDKTHRYSMSKIYDLANRVFDRKEIPQSCASCLIRKVRELRNWLDTRKQESEEKSKIKNEKRRMKNMQ
ncbi:MULTISPECIES: hypothetical protein [unclassified Dysgonomonas]|uniref:hypothetical protein n=1 Tax=unclassified Dysgonomonas TaxID=2630389 RepID=UPI0025BDE7DC|nr:MULTISPECIES: hypothetical protein [unclassified Dysgonomonas]HMM04112.1 hypothetical protein [Dysgonomonas sp.]